MDLRSAILLPLLAQVLLTALVWLWMYKTRISEIIKNNINIQKGASALDAAKLLKNVSGPSDNFSNLFEVPVLFFVAILTLYAANLVNETYLLLCTAYVALRYIHSFIHLSYNNVIHRFTAYALSTMILWILWLLIAIDIIKYSA